VRPFLDTLAEAPLLWDGAMGSLLYERGVYLTRCFDELNLSQPEIIAQIHRDYVAAGADVIETNTFGANRMVLARHGYAERTKEIVWAGVEVARQAVAGREVYIAGAVGPSGLAWATASEPERQLAREALGEHIRELAAAGVDLICLETFPTVEELELAIGLAKQVAPGLPIAAHATFGDDGTVAGVPPVEVARRLAAAGADVVGANCGAGPPELFGVAEAMVPVGKPVSIQPNAGLPRVIESRTIYVANPENFGVFARRMLQVGVRMVGGCCGTTPEHTRRMLGAVRMIGARPLPTKVTGGERPKPRHDATGAPPLSLAARSGLGAKLARGEFAVSCELLAPQGVSMGRILEAARKLKAGGIDICNVADGPRASSRMANLAVCALLERETGIETILHVCGRDRNLLAQVAHLLGAHALGLRNLVVITGDPPKLGDYPLATPVYDLDSIGLLRVASELNRGVDPGGKDLGGQTTFVLATGAEPAALDYERELKRLELKKAAGAELIMTQPVYDGRVIERFLHDVKPLGLPVLIGLLPLASHRNAEFLHNEVPGMRVPDDIRARMAKVGSGAAARAEGVRIARETLQAVRRRVQGAYIMPPFDRVESALEILEA
jgi:methionine synthase I (cobalamin-dependent)/5,10-methylenetetrahydrofolate reductase